MESTKDMVLMPVEITSNKNLTHLENSNGKTDVFEIDIEVTALPYNNFQDKTLKLGWLSHSMIIIIAFVIILALLLLCCVTLFLMRRWKKKYYNCLQRDEGCDPNCAGSRRPLLRRDKSMDSISRASNSSARN